MARPIKRQENGSEENKGKVERHRGALLPCLVFLSVMFLLDQNTLEQAIDRGARRDVLPFI
jgi:hypothetical protein